MGKGLDFLRWSVDLDTDFCILWPFSPVVGRAYVYKDGKLVKASHVVLEMDGRPRPSPEHQGLHDPLCNNPLCVNKRHLRWGTARDNQLDRFVSGTITSSVLTEEDVKVIRSSPEKAQTVADKFNVTLGTIYDIRQRRTWKHVA